jgi:hypothetical protein
VGEMSDHDLLQRLDERTEEIKRDIVEIKLYMATRPCPSTLCQKHENDITRIDTTIKVVAAISIFVVPLVLSVLFYMMRV